MTGVDVVEEPPSTDIDQLYWQYVASQTKKNWKFYIVSCPHFMSEFDNFFPFQKKSMMFRRFLILIRFQNKISFYTSRADVIKEGKNDSSLLYDELFLIIRDFK